MTRKRASAFSSLQSCRGDRFTSCSQRARRSSRVRSLILLRSLALASSTAINCQGREDCLIGSLFTIKILMLLAHASIQIVGVSVNAGCFVKILWPSENSPFT